MSRERSWRPFQHPAVAVRGRRKYHPLHATHLGTYRPTRGALPHRSQYHPAHTGCDGGRPNRMDALSPRISYSSRGPRADRMDLDRHGLRHLWNGGIGIRPCHSHEHSRRTGRNRYPVPLQCDERDRELLIDPVRRARVFAFVSREPRFQDPALPILRPLLHPQDLDPLKSGIRQPGLRLGCRIGIAPLGEQQHGHRKETRLFGKQTVSVVEKGILNQQAASGIQGGRRTPK